MSFERFCIIWHARMWRAKQLSLKQEWSMVSMFSLVAFSLHSVGVVSSSVFVCCFSLLSPASMFCFVSIDAAQFQFVRSSHSVCALFGQSESLQSDSCSCVLRSCVGISIQYTVHVSRPHHGWFVTFSICNLIYVAGL